MNGNPAIPPLAVHMGKMWADKSFSNHILVGLSLSGTLGIYGYHSLLPLSKNAALYLLKYRTSSSNKRYSGHPSVISVSEYYPRRPLPSQGTVVHRCPCQMVLFYYPNYQSRGKKL